MIASCWNERDDDRLVDLIYDTAFDRSLWSPVLDALADRAGAHPANMVQINVVDGGGSGLTARTPDDTLSRYFGQWAQRNPIGLVQDVGDYRLGWTPRITHDEECLDRRRLERSDYWNEFLVPVGAFHSIFVRLALRDNDIVSISLGRPSHLGPFSDEEIARIKPFHRHLIRAERIGRSLGSRQAEFDQLDALLAGSSEALFFLDDRFKLLRWTSAADLLLRDGSMLRDVGGQLCAARAGPNAQLQRALASALAAGAPSPLTLPGATPDGAITVSVARMGERIAAGLAGARCLMVCARPLVGRDEDAAGTLRTRYELTVKEAELAMALATGHSLRDVAARRGVSFYTARNQLTAVFDKTGCRRQQDLVRLLTTRRA